MKAVIATPAHFGVVHACCAFSVSEARVICERAGVQTEWLILPKFQNTALARNILATDFLDTDGTDLVFIDADEGFRPDSLLRLLRHGVDVVAGIPPLHSDRECYPVTLKPGPPVNGLIEAEAVGTGFLRITRQALLKTPHSRARNGNREYTRWFEYGRDGMDDIGHDVSFARKWKSVGGRLWVDPDIDFIHTGPKDWRGNLHKYLLSSGDGTQGG